VNGQPRVSTGSTYSSLVAQSWTKAWL